MRGFGDIDITVTVKKDWLQNTVKKNREEHHEVFAKAFDKYREALIAFLTQELAKVKTGKEVTVTHFRGVMPEDHTDDYDLVLSMMEQSTASEVELTGTDYRRFVQDRWDWTDMFVSASNSYGVSTKFDRGN